MEPQFDSIEEFNAQSDLFMDPKRNGDDNEGPYLIVQDDFYPQPDSIRELALGQSYFLYKPPPVEQVGQEIADKYDHPGPLWLTTSLLCFFGHRVKKPEPGYRHANVEVRDKLSELTGSPIDLDSWHEMGDWWNGAFHIQYKSRWEGDYPGNVHHHYKHGDVYPRGWSGVVYLSPDAPESAGTSFWRDRKTGSCVASLGAVFERDLDKFELMLLVENRYNRLVLFRENVLHRTAYGFGGTPETGRLTQTFFFLTAKEDQTHA